MTGPAPRRYGARRHIAMLTGNAASATMSPHAETRLNHEATKEVRRYQPRDRACMACQNKFYSTGPHHRMCDKCRRGDVYDGHV